VDRKIDILIERLSERERETGRGRRRGDPPGRGGRKHKLIKTI